MNVCVSKHRRTIFIGGRIRNDPPPGFFERLGLKDFKAKALFPPMAEIILMPQPKTPWQKQRSTDSKDYDKLEDIVEKFCTFVNASGAKALQDARSMIKLNHYDFIRE